MSQVIDHLWLGDEDTAVDKDFLTQNKIDIVLNVAGNYPEAYQQKIPAYYGIMLIDWEYPDDDDYDVLRQQIEKAVNFIHNTVNQKKNILVHCHKGVNRAPLVVGTYLKRFHQYDFNKTIKLLEDVNKSRGQENTLINWFFKDLLK